MSASERIEMQDHPGWIGETIASQFTRLKGQIASLMELKSALLKEEMKENSQAYIRDGIMMGVAVLLAVFALIFLHFTVAFLLARLFPFTPPVRYACGAAIVMLIDASVGAFLFFKAKSALASRSPLPQRSIEEIKRDQQWLTNIL